MTSTGFIGLACLLCLLAGAIQYGGWARLAARRLRDPDFEVRRAALKHWLVFAAVYQVAVLAAVGIYVLVMSSAHAHGLWPAPAVGAVVGTALPLQVAAAGVMRAATR